MEIRKIDNLFKGKLKSQVNAPKEESWEKLESMLDKDSKKKVLWIWKVAAVVIVFITSFLIFRPLNDAENIQMAMNIEIPIKEEVLIEKVPQKVKEIKVLEKKERVQFLVKENQQIVNERSLMEQKVVVEPFKEKELEVAFTENILVDTTNSIADLKKPVNNAKKLLPIRITYKRTRRISRETLAIVSTDTVQNGIRNLVEKTRQINPGELWADMRDAKDEFFNTPLDLTKRKLKNSNK